MFITMPTQDEQKLVAIIDDDDSIRMALETLMEVAGVYAFSCASAEEFLRSTNKQHTVCLVADICMSGMSGLELQSRLNSDGQRIPIIFLTAHGDEDIRLQAMRAGAVEFLAKPFDDEALLECVRVVLSG
jgi:FixJ family two-component response regulator